MKKCFTAIAIAMILVSFSACKKKGEESISEPPLRKGPILDAPLTTPGHQRDQRIQFEVVVPEEVKNKWSAVKLLVEDKKLSKTQEFTVNLGDELKIPDSKITVKVEHFFPDFKMSGQIITSASNKPNNPSAGIVVFEAGKQIFPESGKVGWIYEKFPTVHPFQHKRFGLILKGGVERQ